MKVETGRLSSTIDQVVDAAENRDDKGFWGASYRIAGKGKATTRAQPPADSDESRAEAWAVYAEELFSASTREAARPRIKLSPATARLGDKNNVPVSEKVRAHLEHLRKNRAAGPSGLPVEAYLSSPAATQVLITIIQRCFEEECLPEDLPHSSFISIFKSGDTTDRAKYRLLALQEVAAKLLSSLLLERIAYEVGETPAARARVRVTAPSMIEVQNFEFAGNLSSQSPSSSNGPINQTNSTGKTFNGHSTGKSLKLKSLNGHSTGKSLKLNPDAEVFTNPRTRQKEKKSVAASQDDSQDTGSQVTGNLHSQFFPDTTDFQQKVTLPEDATNKSYLPITQAGFRKGRSVRDNTFSLRTLMEMAIELEKELIVVFVDMEKAFDRISHAFLEEALSDAGASDKSIAMIRVLYAQTKAKMRVTAADGTQKISREFPINRGVLQGDLVSPLLFIIALEYAFRKCDTGSSFSILGIFLDQLTYADDSALSCASVEEASTRMAALKKGLLEMADMQCPFMTARLRSCTHRKQ